MTTRFVSISVACNSYTTHYVANVEPFPMTNRSDREGLLRPTDRLQVHQTVSARAGCLLDRKEDLHGSVGPAKCDDDSEKRLHLGGTRLDLETSSVLHLRISEEIIRKFRVKLVERQNYFVVGLGAVKCDYRIPPKNYRSSKRGIQYNNCIRNVKSTLDIDS